MSGRCKSCDKKLSQEELNSIEFDLCFNCRAEVINDLNDSSILSLLLNSQETSYDIISDRTQILSKV